MRQPLTELPRLRQISHVRHAGLAVIGGPIGGTIIVTVICLALLAVRRWRTALYVALAEAAGSGCSQLIKHVVLRHRPPHPLVTADLGSFPSGHVITALSVGLALTVAFTRPADWGSSSGGSPLVALRAGTGPRPRQAG
jgi:membrane-associated phospholipid phosphatase